jgi:hypothetical protein
VLKNENVGLIFLHFYLTAKFYDVVKIMALVSWPLSIQNKTSHALLYIQMDSNGVLDMNVFLC